MVEDEWTKKDHKRHYGPYPGGKPSKFSHFASHTKHAPGDRFVKKDIKKRKEQIADKYGWQCPHCHRWFSHDQRRNHACPASV
jgi:hypothetical protein